MENEAIAYLRTSSAANVGKDKDSDKRQRAAIDAYATASGLQVVDEFYDAAVSGADPVDTRPGFGAMLDRIEGNGVRLVLVEDASRFARDLMVQEAGLAMLVSRGVRVLTSSGDDLTDTTDPMRKMLRQIVGAVMEAEKARLVAKLRAARDRKAAQTGKPCGGRTHDAERLAALRELRSADPDAPYRVLSERLAERGFLTLPPTKPGAVAFGGKPLSTTEIGRMVAKLERAA